MSGEEGTAWGSGGLLRGRENVDTLDSTEAVAAPVGRGRVRFGEFSSYEVTPVTAKHNLVPDDDEEYVRSTIQFPETSPMETTMPDGGCEITDYIEVRPATEGVKAIHRETDDYSFGQKVSTPSRTVTKMPFLFDQVPSSFGLQVGQKIGIAVFRTYDIDHTDAEAPKSTDMKRVYGENNQACIYTGKVTEISSNGKTFGHDINTFEGCSGAVVFLLDLEQKDNMDPAIYGMAVGIHTGGLDTGTNIAFKLPKSKEPDFG